MKNIYKILFILMFAISVFGCGSATEVGNPTDEIPILRTVEGVIDLSTLEESKSIGVEVVDAALLSVVATATDGSIEEAAVDVNGSFAIDLEVGKTYSLEVRMSGETIGPFSFEQDDSGNRANRLEITQSDEPINLGQVRYQNGEFIPENEPRRQMGGGGSGNG